jgi:hypothetical protein
MESNNWVMILEAPDNEIVVIKVGSIVFLIYWLVKMVMVVTNTMVPHSTMSLFTAASSLQVLPPLV